MPQNVASVKRERSCSLTASVGYISQAEAEWDTGAETGAGIRAEIEVERGTGIGTGAETGARLS